jgi:ribonucleoside-diphosphate reductase alpha chain
MTVTQQSIITINGNGFEINLPSLFSKSGLQGYKIFLDRYTLKAKKGDLQPGDLVLVITVKDPKFPQKEIGIIQEVLSDEAYVLLQDGKVIKESFDLISKPLETEPEQVKERVANALASSESPTVREYWVESFRNILFDKFIPGGRILAGAGVSGLTLQNCFVLPSPHDSRSGIMDRLKEMAETHSRGGGVGLNLSSLRPRYAHVIGVNGISSGAVSWGKMFNLSTGLIEQGGSRRGATMLMINDWHPDVMEFITAKHTPGEFENVNMSVCISDAFMEAVKADLDWDLVFPDTKDPDYDSVWDGNLDRWIALNKGVKVYKTVRAREIWNAIVESAWASAEPGLHFLERSNKMSNSWYFAPLVATNPCGEQPLEAYGVCTLGAIDLSRFVKDKTVDWDDLKFTVATAVRFLDNVIDINEYHFESIYKNHTGNRRIGLGVMGLAEMLLRLNIKYGSAESVAFIDELFETIATEAYMTSSSIAKEKGSFPKYDEEKYLMSGFTQALPKSVRSTIKENGIRNICILTVAPTGTTGTMVGTSTGVEPYFNWRYTRTSRLGVHTETVPVLNDLGIEVNNLPDYCVTAMDLKPEAHVAVQAAVQRWVDSAISKTTNCPSDYTVKQTNDLYMLAYDLGCKGITIYRDNSREIQVLNNIQEEDDVIACSLDDPECTTCAL